MVPCEAPCEAGRTDEDVELRMAGHFLVPSTAIGRNKNFSISQEYGCTMTDNASFLPSADSDALLRTIGNTPLFPLLRIGKEFPRVRILAKAEWYNPGGSVKDRPAYRMIRAAELSGQLTPSKIILDATSGNTGIAYAMIAARRGYQCKLLMPANASTERKKLLKAYGAEVVLTD